MGATCVSRVPVFVWRIVVVKDEATDRDVVSSYPFSVFQIRHVPEMSFVTQAKPIKSLLQTTIIGVEQKGRSVLGYVKFSCFGSPEDDSELLENSHNSLDPIFSIHSNQYEDFFLIIHDGSHARRWRMRGLLETKFLDRSMLVPRCDQSLRNNGICAQRRRQISN